MKIHTRTIWDIETGAVLADECSEYRGPLALCDRSLNDMAKQNARTASSQAGNYGAQAGGIQSELVPRLQQYSQGNTPGYGAIGLGEMETAAESTAGAASGAAQEEMKLRAMRTGNAAGVGAGQAAAAGETARAQGGALQSILAKNAELKARQQESATAGLEGILGDDMRGQVANAGLVPEDINAASNAQKQGWLQNTLGVVNTLGDLGKSASGLGLRFGRG